MLATIGTVSVAAFKIKRSSTSPYQELFVRVNEVAALLRDFCGLKKGDHAKTHLRAGSAMAPPC